MYIDYIPSLMLNKIMKKAEFILLFIIIFVVYILYQSITSLLYKNVTVDSSDLINNKVVSSQELYDKSWESVKKNYIDSTCNSQDWNRWKNRYKGKLKTDEDARIAIETMLASLNDNYTRFLPQSEYKEQFNSIESHFYGIGVEITSVSGRIVVHGVLPDTPAQKAGILSNDIILSVNGKNINGMDLYKVSDIIRGPEHSSVTLKIKRGRHTIVKRIKREKINIKSIESSIKNKNIGYIKVKSFIGANTSDEFITALKKMDNTKGLIIDLRGNTGGLFTNAIAIANLFIKDGKIVSIVSKNGKKNDINAFMKLDVVNKPTVVLVDGISASASEILSGALRDNKKAVLVGTTTFGKGLVQQIVPLPNNSGLNITIAKYLTPNGDDINKKGIKPDYIVEYTIKDYKNHNDTQLKKAEEVINSLCKK